MFIPVSYFFGHMFSKDFKNLMNGNNMFRKMLACLDMFGLEPFSLRETNVGGGISVSKETHTAGKR